MSSVTIFIILIIGIIQSLVCMFHFCHEKEDPVPPDTRFEGQVVEQFMEPLEEGKFPGSTALHMLPAELLHSLYSGCSCPLQLHTNSRFARGVEILFLGYLLSLPWGLSLISRHHLLPPQPSPRNPRTGLIQDYARLPLHHMQGSGGCSKTTKRRCKTFPVLTTWGIYLEFTFA
ncbi:Hypothetical predicted protein [Podarcis lilfordi]|uniref:Uncharacterized protein n=1 Tax=Podarcis lilfordi TaxID=74358 RepID=A0AA35PB82_9SAUR|nr:Hypothetical predicted protein [Podarcis lilfordi]